MGGKPACGMGSVRPMARKGRAVGAGDWSCCGITGVGGTDMGFWATGR